MKTLFASLFFASLLGATSISQSPDLSSWDLTVQNFSCSGQNCGSLTATLNTVMPPGYAFAITNLDISDSGNIITNDSVISVNYSVFSHGTFGQYLFRSPTADFMGHQVSEITQTITDAVETNNTSVVCETSCADAFDELTLGSQALTEITFTDTFYLGSFIGFTQDDSFGTSFSTPEPSTWTLALAGLVFSFSSWPSPRPVREKSID